MAKQHKWESKPTKKHPERHVCTRDDCGIFRLNAGYKAKNKQGREYEVQGFKRGRKSIIYDPFKPAKVPPCGPPTKQEIYWSM